MKKVKITIRPVEGPEIIRVRRAPSLDLAIAAIREEFSKTPLLGISSQVIGSDEVGDGMAEPDDIIIIAEALVTQTVWRDEFNRHVQRGTPWDLITFELPDGSRVNLFCRRETGPRLDAPPYEKQRRRLAFRFNEGTMKGVGTTSPVCQVSLSNE